MLKRLLCLLLLLSVAVSFSACGQGNTYTVAELSMTVPKGYAPADNGGNSNLLLTNGQSTVSFKRLSFIDAEESGVHTGYTATQFAEFFLINSEINGAVASHGDTPYYSYYDNNDGVRLFSIAAFHRTPYAYFIIIYTTLASREEEGRRECFDMMETVVYNIVD